MQHEFVPCQCAPQLRLHFQARYRAFIHLWQIKLINRGSMFFGLEHRSISVPEQAVRIRTISRIDADTQAGRNIYFLAFQFE